MAVTFYMICYLLIKGHAYFEYIINVSKSRDIFIEVSAPISDSDRKSVV